MLPNGVVEWEGYWEPADRRKIKAVMKLNPDLDLRMVFQAHTIRSEESKSYMPSGVDKHNIPWTSFHDIPLKWLL